MALRPVRFPSAPQEYDPEWGRSIVRLLNIMYNDLAEFRSATGQYSITSTAVNRTITGTASASEVKEVLINITKDLQEKGVLP